MTCFALLEDQRYMVDSDGNVYGPRAGKLKKFKAVKGRYEQVSINAATVYVHRLVAEAFIPNPEGKPDVAHNNGNGLDNRVENLRWATESENMADKVLHGTHCRGEKHGGAKLTDAEVMAIRYCRKQGSGVDSLANIFGVSRWTIYDACNPNRRQLADY